MAKTHTSVYIGGAEVEQISSLRYLGINITENLSWPSHTTLVKRAQKRLFFLGNWRLNFRAKLWLVSTEKLQKASWWGTSQSGLVRACPGQEGSAAGDQNIPEHYWYHLQSISDIDEMRRLHKAQRNLKERTHYSHSLFTLLPSGRRYRSICCCTII